MRAWSPFSGHSGAHPIEPFNQQCPAPSRGFLAGVVLGENNFLVVPHTPPQLFYDQERDPRIGRLLVP